jgi:hypothetical protein
VISQNVKTSILLIIFAWQITTNRASFVQSGQGGLQGGLQGGFGGLQTVSAVVHSFYCSHNSHIRESSSSLSKSSGHMAEN